MSEDEVTTKKRVRKVKADEGEAPAKEKESKKEKAPTFKYTVETLAEDLGIDAASVRVKLRKAQIEKNGRSYGWNNQNDYNKVKKQLETVKKTKKAADEEEGDEE